MRALPLLLVLLLAACSAPKQDGVLEFAYHKPPGCRAWECTFPVYRSADNRYWVDSEGRFVRGVIDRVRVHSFTARPAHWKEHDERFFLRKRASARYQEGPPSGGPFC